MIARIIIYIVVGTLLPYLWMGWSRFRSWSWHRRLLFVLPPLVVIGYSGYLALLPNFVPSDPALVDIWFVVMACFAVPQFVYAVCSWIGWGVQRSLKTTHNWGRPCGKVLAVLAFVCFVYGFTFGFREMQVKRITVYVPDLPKSFDGYRIVQFSDIHMGSYYGWRHDLPYRDIDSIRAQHADMICFTGDLQNAQPSELAPYVKLLGSLRAKDGVYSVLGNHDYSYYVDTTRVNKDSIERQVRLMEAKMGWRLLNNEHVVVRRGTDSIYVAGTENYDKPKHTQVARSLYGIRRGNFVLMLQHIPTQWKDMVPSRINAVYGSKDTVLLAPQLTLSGHTHAGQISVLGLRPTMFANYDYGLYEREGVLLYTTSGLGGVVPIRLGATAEIVVITLRCKK